MASLRASLAAAALILLLPRSSPACMRGYESPESVAARAAHIVEVEVLSTSALTVGDLEREAGRARVRVAREVRGRLPVREFTLVGGPYESCSIVPPCLEVEEGERLCLLLDGPVPETTDTIRITWAARVFRGTGSEIEARIRRCRAAWHRRLRLLRRLWPDDFETAERRRADLRSTGRIGPRDLEAASYPALAALAELLRDPADPLPHPAAPRWNPDVVGPGAPAARIEHPTGTWITETHRYAHLPPELAVALNERISDRPEEVLEFGRRVLRAWLMAELLQPEERADRFVARVTRESLLRRELPLRGIRLETDADTELRSVRRLLQLADPRPDDLVRSRPRVAPADYDPTVFVSWLRRHADELPTARSHTTVCLSVRHEAAAPVVVRALAAEKAVGLLPAYLGFLLAIGDPENAAAVVDLAGDILREAAAEPAGESRLPWRSDHYAKALDALIAEARGAGELGAPLVPRLEGLRTLLER